MLKLLVRDPDIYKISKLLGKNCLKASITSSIIIIDSDEILDEVIDRLFEYATIISAQNYHAVDDATNMDSEIKVEKDTFADNPLEVAKTNQVIDEVETETNESITEAENLTFAEILETTDLKQAIEKYDDETVDSEYHLENSTNLVTQEDVEVEKPKKTRNKIPKDQMVYRGEVYKWGSIRKDEDKEGNIKECVIIIQNDYQMSASEDTIALFCTSHYEERAPIRFSFALTEANMVDHNRNMLGFYDHCTMFVGHIKGINRNQLGKYLGTMNSSFMNSLQPTIDFCMGLKRSRTVNRAQLQMLSTINVADLLLISDAPNSNTEKVTAALKLFNFDMTGNGMNYVKKAILIAYKLGDYRLEDLAQVIAEEENVESEEVLRLIVARIKENFKFRKSPAISFIRLIHKLLQKG